MPRPGGWTARRKLWRACASLILRGQSPILETYLGPTVQTTSRSTRRASEKPVYRNDYRYLRCYVRMRRAKVSTEEFRHSLHLNLGRCPLWVMCGRRLGKNFLTLLQHWSGAVMCPACLCGDDPNGF